MSALVVLVATFALIESGSLRVKTGFFDKQVEAAHLMKTALDALAVQRMLLGIPIDLRVDPNRTGIIGEELTDLTTTIGNLEAKRTSTNPDLAAVIVKYFHELGLDQGDIVAIGASGSFPSVLLAVLCAVEVMELSSVVIYSVGSSMYGGNIPGFTFLEMLSYLRSAGILNSRIVAISPGGENDTGKGTIMQDFRDYTSRLAEIHVMEAIIEDDLQSSILRRIEIYSEAARNQRISCFVNIGGADANYGVLSASLSISPGIVQNTVNIPQHPERGLIFEFLEAGIPVIHLLNIREIALRESITIDPVPLPQLGRSKVYFDRIAPDRLIASAGLVLSFGAGLLINRFSAKAHRKSKSINHIRSN